MATRVAKHPRPLVTPANGEEWHAESVTFDVIARAGDRGGRDKHARHRAQQLEFVGESTRVEVVLDGLTPCLALVGGACVDMSEDAPNDLDVIGNQGLCWSAHVCQYHAMGITCQRSCDVCGRVVGHACSTNRCPRSTGPGEPVDRRPPAERALGAGVGLVGRRPASSHGGGARRDGLLVRHQRGRRAHVPVANGVRRQNSPATAGAMRSPGGCRNDASASTKRPGSTKRLRDHGTEPGNWQSSRWSAGRQPIASGCGRQPLHCIWPNSGRECGYGRITLTRNGFRCREPCSTSSAPTFTVRLPTSPPTRCDRCSRWTSGPTTRSFSSRR